MRIDELLGQYEEYITHEIQLAPATISNYLSDLRKYSCFTSKEVAAITADDLREYMRHLSKIGLQSTSIRRKIHGFTTFWEWLKMQDIVQDVITQEIRLPRKDTKVPRWLNKPELAKFVNTPVKEMFSPWQAQRDSMAWKTLAWLGIRRGELLNMKIDDVKLDDWEVVIRNTKGKRDRVIPLPEPLLTDLEMFVRGRDKSDYVFGESGGKKWSKRNFHKAFNLHLDHCGLKGSDITPRTLRHTFATHMVAKTGNLAVVKEMTGHKDVKSLFIYVHAAPEWIKDAMSKNILHELVNT